MFFYGSQLVSGLTIKTINGISLLGSGNIVISVGTIRENDWQSPYNYCGFAPIGSLTSQNVWTIRRIQVMPDGTTITLQAFNVAWDDRYFVIYT